MSIRPVLSESRAQPTMEGAGVHLHRAFGFTEPEAFDPFLMFDDFRNDDPRHYQRGFPWHPHRGIETITYVLSGSVEHGDSLGNRGILSGGDVQWMTAGSGILHIEKPPESLVMSGGLFHGLQLWVNLPSTMKMTDPRYQDIRGKEVALLSSSDGGALLRVIAGEVDGHDGPGITHTPISVVHATVAPGARVQLPWRKDFNALVYVLAGRGSVGAERRPVEMGQLAVFGPGDVIEVAANRAAVPAV